MSTKIQMEKIAAGNYRGPAIITYFFEDSQALTADQITIEKRSQDSIAALVKAGQFKACRFETNQLTIMSQKGLRRIVLIGLGEKKDFCPGYLRTAAAIATEELLMQGIGDVASTFMDPEEKTISLRDQAQLIVEGASQGGYQFDAYRAEKKSLPATLENFILLAKDLPPGPVREGMNWGRNCATGTNYARTLGNHPANVATPEFLAREAEEMSKRYNSMQCRILERKDIENLGMGAFLSVNKASSREQPLKLIILELRGARRAPARRGGPEKDKRSQGQRNHVPRIGLIGKGITFDTGGISLKSPKNLHTMKYDMCGAAAVLGTMRSLAELRLPVDVLAMIPTTENMPGSNATRPGDIVKSMSGKTIEILNTDAEGRLILCDTITYMQQQKVDAIIDIATLTAACAVALGGIACGLFSNSDRLSAQLQEASHFSADRLWRLPIWPEYHRQPKSNVADLKNIGGSYANIESAKRGGAITAACFLEEFIESTPWAHLDIAGTADRSSSTPGMAAGATGFGVRLILEFLRKYRAI